MPNWCYSTLSVEGDEKEVNRFKEYAETKEKECVLDNDKFIPYPKEFKEKDEVANKIREIEAKEREKKKLTNEEKRLILLSGIDEDMKSDGYNSGGYEWCCREWGSKWGICSPHIDTENSENSSLIYSFESAWCPVEPLIQKMSEMFPTLTFEYTGDEESLAFAFEQTWENGEKIFEEDTTEEMRAEREAENEEDE